MSNGDRPPLTWSDILRAIGQRITPERVIWVVLLTSSILTTYFGCKPLPIPPPIPQVVQEEVEAGSQGWVPPTDDETTEAIEAIEAFQQMPAQFSRVARAAIEGDDNRPVFFWEWEKKVLGEVLPSWNQNPAGTCVSFGWGRGAQDLILGQIASGANEKWPGAQVATEPIYGGSRIEVGRGQIRGDGSVGAWAARWVQKWGILFRQKYGAHDLSKYSVPISRSWGLRGVPDELEPIAREHPVRTVAMVTTAEELWSAIGNGYPVPVCSNFGFEGSPPASGIMEPRGSWAHCMLFRGRFEHPTAGRCVVIQNSWGRYIRRLTVDAKMPDGTTAKVELPEGCFAVRLAVAGRMCAQRDTFAMSSFKGFPAKKIPIFSKAPQQPARNRLPLFALAP